MIYFASAICILNGYIGVRKRSFISAFVSGALFALLTLWVYIGKAPGP